MFGSRTMRYSYVNGTAAYVLRDNGSMGVVMITYNVSLNTIIYSGLRDRSSNSESIKDICNAKTCRFVLRTTAIWVYTLIVVVHDKLFPPELNRRNVSDVDISQYEFFYI